MAQDAVAEAFLTGATKPVTPPPASQEPRPTQEPPPSQTPQPSWSSGPQRPPAQQRAQGPPVPSAPTVDAPPVPETDTPGPDTPAADAGAPGSGAPGYAAPAQVWFGGSAKAADAPARSPDPQPSGPRKPREVGAPRPADPGPAGAGGLRNPDAEETDVFVVRGSERRARTRQRQEEPPPPPPGEPAPEPGPAVTPYGDGLPGAEHVPVPGGFEARLAALKPVPSSPLPRAVFSITLGRVNLGPTARS
ncbi:hypothetical protein [Nocardiopsis sp. LOL_012]|uniref:hypothetical protein n=1 Tax=Nocardiopsis sp. LOL_012 TaxID=3345409 RepID=UPI003A837924